MTRHLLRCSILGASLLAGGIALADALPPPDSGTTPKDLATPMAKPDMTVAPQPSDDGCSMTQRRAPLRATLMVLTGALGAIALYRRTRRA